MKTKVEYEWTLEELDGENIVDSNFASSLSFFCKDSLEGKDLGLVRNEGNEDKGVTDRYWAYVKDGKLPEFFTNANGDDTGIAVPQKYHKQLASYL